MTLLNSMRAIVLMLIIAGYSAQLMAQQKILMIESTITGSQEQPRVLSIVPWQGVEEPAYVGGDIVLEHTVGVFKPIDRDAFNKEIRYIKATRRIN